MYPAFTVGMAQATMRIRARRSLLAAAAFETAFLTQAADVPFDCSIIDCMQTVCVGIATAEQWESGKRSVFQACRAGVFSTLASASD